VARPPGLDRIVPATIAKRQSSHDPSASARNPRGPSVGMTIQIEAGGWVDWRRMGWGVGSLFSGGLGRTGNSLPLASISLLYTDYYCNDMAGLGGFRLASSVTVIDVLQHLGLPYSMVPRDSSPEVISCSSEL
jgi:hypothetical protein